MARPTLKQFGDLAPEDFKRHPIWVSVHTLDNGEDWYDETDEETFRPWLDVQPVHAEEMFLVSAQFTFADGSVFDGFVSPVASYYNGLGSMGFMQPQVFSPAGKRFGFWFGMFGKPDLASFYQSFTKSSAQIFPIHFQPRPGLTSAVGSGDISGFMSKPDEQIEISA